MRVDQMDGMFVGLLVPDEIEALEAAIRRGDARRSYEGGAGLMGLAKVRLLAPAAPREQSEHGTDWKEER